MPTANSAALTRRYNRRVVLDALRREGSLSRVELSRRSGLTPQGVRNIVEDLLKDGFVVETGRRKGQRGQPQIDIALNDDAGYCIGLQVSDGQCSYVAANLAGKVIRLGGPYPFAGNAAVMNAALVSIDRDIRGSLSGVKRLGAGIVFSRPLRSRWSAVGESTQQLDAQCEVLEAFFRDEQVVFENDANAAAMAEVAFGRGKQRGSDFLYFFVGDGVGGAIVQNGALYRGARGNAGEFGHILIDPTGPVCHCGNKGCLHGYLSLASLRAALPPTVQLEPGSVPQEWYASAAAALRRGVVSLENIFDPPRIIIGGTAPRWVFENIVNRLGDEGKSVRSTVAAPRLEISELGANCALLGASALPLLAMTTPSLKLLTKE